MRFVVMGGNMPEMALEKALEQAAGMLRRAGSVVALTGAGVSVASGIPDFRSPGGLWERHDPMTVATAEALVRRPDRVWAFLREVLGMVDAARPNPAHFALAQLEAAGRLSGIITQNIDGLHQAAGSRNVVEYHGGLGHFACMGCGRDHDPVLARGLAPEALPWHCEACGGVVRPDIVFFGEAIPLDALRKSGQLALAADVIVVVGTSGEVAPANCLPREDKAAEGRVFVSTYPTMMNLINDTDGGKRLFGPSRRQSVRAGAGSPAGFGCARAFLTSYKISHRWVAMDALTPHGGIWAMMAGATPTVIFVLCVLAFMSLGCWSIIFVKFFTLTAAKRDTARDYERFQEADTLRGAMQALGQSRHSPAFFVGRMAFEELVRMEQADLDPSEKGHIAMDNIRRVLRQGVTVELAKLSKSLPFVATTANATPFIGLFGTVWGIMNSFHSIGQQQSAALAAVAPGISEALVATAIGLAVAIPAVLAYNYFLGFVTAIENELVNFAGAFLNRIQREVTWTPREAAPSAAAAPRRPAAPERF